MTSNNSILMQKHGEMVEISSCTCGAAERGMLTHVVPVPLLAVEHRMLLFCSQPIYPVSASLLSLIGSVFDVECDAVVKKLISCFFLPEFVTATTR